MGWTAEDILDALDRCSAAYKFPMLDNGYVYPVATRLSLFRSDEDWALVIEVFGFSPRAGIPDTFITTFASRLNRRKTPEKYVSEEAYQRFLANHPNDESHGVFPIEEGEWLDDEDGELVARGATRVLVRGTAIVVPPRDAYAGLGIELEDPAGVRVFELCRYLAAVAREDVLATAIERRMLVPPELTQIMQHEEWNHPNIADGEQHPGGSQTFQQLARVLETGAVDAYRPSLPPNTHWRHWPEGGTL